MMVDDPVTVAPAPLNERCAPEVRSVIVDVEPLALRLAVSSMSSPAATPPPMNPSYGQSPRPNDAEHPGSMVETPT
jgi:hypothetical protein